jgi:hypothetical protein
MPLYDNTVTRSKNFPHQGCRGHVTRDSLVHQNHSCETIPLMPFSRLFHLSWSIKKHLRTGAQLKEYRTESHIWHGRLAVNNKIFGLFIGCTANFFFFNRAWRLMFYHYQICYYFLFFVTVLYFLHQAPTGIGILVPLLSASYFFIYWCMSQGHHKDISKILRHDHGAVAIISRQRENSSSSFPEVSPGRITPLNTT